METEKEAFKMQVLLGRVYFLALLPFIGAVVAPWVLGPEAVSPAPTFVIWSFSVLLFVSAASVGYAVGRNEKLLRIHGFVSLLLAAAGIACVLLAMATTAFFSSVAILNVLHWAGWMWIQKSRTLDKDFFKQHNRFVWTTLACHMLVMLNLIYAAKAA